MFSKDIYIKRREILKKEVGNGIILILGNLEASRNYPDNTFKYRQDSSFLYYFGQQRDGLVGVIDIDNDKEYLFGNDIDIDDLIWYGPVDNVAALAMQVGIVRSGSIKQMASLIDSVQKSGRAIHYLPVYRAEQALQIAEWLGISVADAKAQHSVELIKAVVKMRSIKQPEEIAELEKAAHIGYLMHTTAIASCKPGVEEQHIAGLLEGIAVANGCDVSFETILTQHGEIMHNHSHLNTLESGRLMLVDAGGETHSNYCSDNTRTCPVGRKFTTRQKEIYDIVVKCHDHALAIAKPGIKWLDVHLEVCKILASGLKDLGLMKGNIDDAVAAGAHALFMPHGLGHMMGMDVHDMEGLGQKYVGFDDEVQPSTQFGTNCLRLGRRLQKGFVVTDEPGCYFIPALIDQFRAKGLHTDFINYDKVEQYKDFGGIRLEDDIIITDSGCQIIGNERIPLTSEEVESFMINN